MADTDAKPLLKQWLTDDDYFLIGQAVANGYKGCNVLMDKNPLFSSFAIGRDFRSRLLGICVEHELDKMCLEMDDFHPEIKFNNARNCLHLRIHKKQLTMTAHFMGRSMQSIRKYVRTAKNRAILCDRNLDMFSSEYENIDITNKGAGVYCQIMHGGTTKPLLSMLTIPSHNQHGILAKSDLPIPEPEVVSEEKIEEYMLKLNTQTEEFENGNVKENTGGLSA